jgi:hypothetical protein
VAESSGDRGLHGRARSLGIALGVVGLFVAVSMVSLPGTAALLTGDYPVVSDIAASRIFRDERTSPAFYVNDVSSGSASDRSSGSAFAGDSRYFLSRTWPAAFDSSRYLDFDMNAPLPAGLSATGVTLRLRVASDLGTGSVCLYAELRRASTNALLSSHGSSVSPLGCSSGTTYLALNVSTSAVTTTDVANDLRIRVFARDSALGSMRIDQATVTGDTPYVTFTLYPILTREQYNGQTELLRWGLAGP